MAFDNAPYGDIRATLAVSEDEARSGSRRVVNLPGGRSVTVTVSAGIQDGAEIRLAGQGEVYAPNGKAGDLILRISVIAAQRFDEQPSADAALPTMAMQQPFLSAANQAPTEYTPNSGGYPSAATPYPPTEQYAFQSAPVAPQPYTGYGTPPHYPTYTPVGTALASQPPPPRRRSGVVTLLVILIVLVLLVGGGSLYYIGYYQPSQVQSAANATAQVQATGTAQVVQATAHVEATSTAQAQATVQVHQALYTQVTQGTPTLNNSMSGQSNSQWEEFTSSVGGICSFTQGSYHAYMPKANFFQPCFARKNLIFRNFAFQIDMTIVQGDQGGIIFRANEASDKFYLLSVSTSGTYYLYAYVSNQGSQAQTLLSGHSSLILPAGQSNEITLIAQGNQLTIYINKQYLDSIDDATYSTGAIGVFGESQNQPTDVAFSNIKVWTL